MQRGEITLVVQGAARRSARASDRRFWSARSALLLEELPPGKAAALAAQLTGAKRSEAYAIALRATQR